MVSFQKCGGLLLILVLFSLCSFADTNGKIYGLVTDSSGGVIASATVTAIQAATGEQKTTQTDSRGNYSLLALPPGQYDLRVRISGFRIYEQQGIKVDVSSALEINVVLAVGSTEAKVVVTSDALRVEEANTQLGDVIGGRTMENLPLNGRSYTNLLGLQSGVIPVSSGIPDTI
ncbi:MAG TPA: carboxypeptidase-like regulatory domain-containing protein, partial [Candidatus Angelobacter sp.]